MTFRPLTAIVLLAALDSALAAQDGTGELQRLPPLIEADSWNSDVPPGQTARLETAPSLLLVSLSPLQKGDSARFTLKSPIPVPDWATGFSFRIGNLGQGSSLGFRPGLLIQDAAGEDFLYTASSSLVPSGAYYPNNFRCRPLDFAVPGLSHPVLLPHAGANIAALGGQRLPRAPLTLVGIQLDGASGAASAKQATTQVFFQDFAFTRLSETASAFRYLLDDQEQFGSFRPEPGVTVGRVGGISGEDVSIRWEIRDRYDGPPFLLGGEDFHWDSTDPRYALNFNSPISFPVREKGTYWIRVTRKSSRKGSPFPERIDTAAFRLDILAGDPPHPRPPVPPEAMAPHSFVRLCPERSSAIFRADEPFRFQARFQVPAEFPASSYRIQVSTNDTEETVKTFDGAVPAPDKPLSLDLAGLPPGAYRVRAEVDWQGHAIDQAETVLGLLDAKGDSPAPATAPAPSRESASNGDSLIYLDPQVNAPTASKRWDSLRAFLDQAPAVTSRVELQVRWSDVEPLPGVFDWAELDRALDYAGQKHLTVLLWPQFVGEEPEWMPSYFEQPRDEGGSTFGPKPYTFHGGRINYWHAEAPRRAALDFVMALAKRYSAHPAVHGYFLLTEQPGDLPSANWLVGGSPDTLADFQDYSRRSFGTLDKVNQRWGTSFGDWASISLPHDSSSSRYRLDWLAFLRQAFGAYLLELVKAVRSVDPARLIMVYTDGADPRFLPQFHALGCMVADGGSQYPETFGARCMGIAAYGVPRRTEEVSVGQWSAKFPTQLDASLFTMALGGGGNANCKMYIPPNASFDDLRKPPYSLDRFQQFIPIWNELRSADVLPRDAYILDDTGGQLLEADSTQLFGDAYTFMACMNAGILAPAVPLDMMAPHKLLILPRLRHLEAATIDGIAEYVGQGGTVLLCADGGRWSPDLPGEDWILLRRLGFAPPSSPLMEGNFRALPQRGGILSDTAGPFRLQGQWPHVAAPSGEPVLASFDGAPHAPAITSRQTGKGRAIVVWASGILPSLERSEYPFLRDVARNTGATLPCEASSPLLWTNLLKRSSDNTYYGLVYHSNYSLPLAGPSLEGTTRWILPKGRYQVRELISGREIGTYAEDALAATGIPVRLEPYAVAVYRFQSTGENR